MRNACIFALIFLISLSFISAAPQIPVVFSGSASYSENPSLSLQDQEINVSIGAGNWNVGSIEANNQFEIAVDPMGVVGDISFYIGGVQALEKGTYSMGAFIFKDLTINQLPPGVVNYYCGDNVCNGGESCSNCYTDCGSCSSESSSSSSSRSSSSSSNTVIVLSNDNSDDKQQIISNSDISGERLASKKDNSFVELITSGKLLIALFIIVVVLAIIIFSMPKKSE